MDNNGFSYQYSAKEQAELKKIREKYMQKSDDREDKMARIRRLDAGVMQKAQVISLVFGIVGALVLGFGMSLIMSELWEIMELKRGMALFLGITLGIVGSGIASLAYPMYQIVQKRERDRVAPEIIKLTDELMK